MQETSNFTAGIENFSFSNFTKSNAIFSIFSRKTFDAQFVTISRSNPCNVTSKNDNNGEYTLCLPVKCIYAFKLISTNM